MKVFFCWTIIEIVTLLSDYPFSDFQANNEAYKHFPNSVTQLSTNFRHKITFLWIDNVQKMYFPVFFACPPTEHFLSTCPSVKVPFFNLKQEGIKAFFLGQ